MKTNREILKFAFPAIIENFLQMLVGVSDTMIVAHLSLSAVAAVSFANNLITVYQAIFIALGTIVSSLFAKVLIAKKVEENPKRLINSATKLTF
ncbi:MAG: MATE family efflux transporter [Streptococcus salivarius]